MEDHNCEVMGHKWYVMKIEGNIQHVTCFECSKKERWPVEERRKAKIDRVPDRRKR